MSKSVQRRLAIQAPEMLTIDKAVETIEALQTQIEENTSSKMIELSTENEMLKSEIKDLEVEVKKLEEELNYKKQDYDSLYSEHLHILRYCNY